MKGKTMKDPRTSPTFLIDNYLDAEPGPEKDHAALLLSLTPENQPGPNASFERPMRKIGALYELPFRPVGDSTDAG